MSCHVAGQSRKLKTLCCRAPAGENFGEIYLKTLFPLVKIAFPMSKIKKKTGFVVLNPFFLLTFKSWQIGRTDYGKSDLQWARPN